MDNQADGAGDGDPLAIALLGEIAVVEQLAQAQLKRALPVGMEVSHFSVLNHFARLGGEKTPAQLARIFHVTKGAMTNTLSRLERAGYVTIRPDFDDGRRKRVSLSDDGMAARNEALAKVKPVFRALTDTLGEDKIKSALPVLRQMRSHLEPNP
jgi:DNA-binding MarR family transcriptional regulator